MLHAKKQMILKAMLAKNTAPAALTEIAADFMAKNTLTMRNSYTKQLLSLHYGTKRFPETHSSGGGNYCVPLWTVAIPALTQRQLNSSGIENIIKNYLNSIDGNGYQYPQGEAYISEFKALPAALKKEHLDGFLNRIRDFISPYVALGYMFNHKFDYELIIATSDDFGFIDDFGRYATGGRCHRAQNSKSIVYRVTLNKLEIDFLKEILKGDYDSSMHGIKTAEDKVAITARQYLARFVCVEIITNKLVRYLNAAGQLKQVIALNKDLLHSFIPQVLNKKNNPVLTVLEKNQVAVNLEADELLRTNKYSPYQ